ncbi:hydroxylase [Paractinoplanes rishiriensis]|uniref:Hydroxylase n=1 Tax=Paractinoplanes rishiriensis TaxID=1050105 RepID=A0A919N2B5_9ACTN|nr:hydroxylase [Actinoplanes rishiriensis]
MIGAGLTGLSTALLLTRDGHRVTVLDRDPPAPAPGTAWESWHRPGVTQFRFAHIMLPRWHTLMRTELPGVLDRLAAAGGFAVNLAGLLPPEVRDGGRPDDDRFDTLTARRPVLEAVLAAGLTVRTGVAVAGLEVRDRHVTGVRLAGGDILTADLVVDCGGRRSALPAWLAAAGCGAPAEERDDAGFVYYGRHFRGPRPPVRGPLLQHHDSVSVLTLPADNDTWAVAFVASGHDRPLRALRDPDRWTAALDRYPLAAHWSAGTPLTGVDVMAGLADRWRSLVVGGEPVATGVVAVGDSACCTNPSLGRGAAIGLLHACTLRDLLRETEPAEADKLARRFAERTAAVIEPLYRATYWFDRHRIAEMEADAAGVTYRPDDQRWAVARALYVAALSDPEAARANLAISSVLATAPEVLAANGLAARVSAIAGGVRYPMPGPDRAGLLAALN